MTLPQFNGTELFESGDMMDLPKRKSPRIAGYDYSKPNDYFVTICTNDKKCIFGMPGRLNRNGKIAEDCLKRIEKINPAITVDKYVIMPNHIHVVLIISENNDRSTNIATVIGQYKMAVTKRIRAEDPGIIVWQRSFHDHVIRNQQGYEKIWLYIEDNPRKWEEDCFYCTES